MFLRESMPLESSIFSMLSKGKEQYEILFTLLHILEIFEFKEYVFSIFVSQSLNLDFFQKMIIFKDHLKQLSIL
jgi:hypothetical protein